MSLFDCHYNAVDLNLDALQKNCQIVILLEKIGWLCLCDDKAFIIRKNDKQVFYLIELSSYLFHNKSGYYRNNLGWFTVNKRGEYVMNLFMTAKFDYPKNNDRYCQYNYIKKVSDSLFSDISTKMLLHYQLKNQSYQYILSSFGKKCANLWWEDIIIKDDITSIAIPNHSCISLVKNIFDIFLPFLNVDSLDAISRTSMTWRKICYEKFFMATFIQYYKTRKLCNSTIPLVHGISPTDLCVMSRSDNNFLTPHCVFFNIPDEVIASIFNGIACDLNDVSRIMLISKKINEILSLKAPNIMTLSSQYRHLLSSPVEKLSCTRCKHINKESCTMHGGYPEDYYPEDYYPEDYYPEDNIYLDTRDDLGNDYDYYPDHSLEEYDVYEYHESANDDSY